MKDDTYTQAAESCTEVGQEDEPEFYGRQFWRSEVVDALIFAVGLVSFAGAVVLVFGG